MWQHTRSGTSLSLISYIPIIHSINHRLKGHFFQKAVKNMCHWTAAISCEFMAQCYLKITFTEDLGHTLDVSSHFITSYEGALLLCTFVVEKQSTDRLSNFSEVTQELTDTELPSQSQRPALFTFSLDWIQEKRLFVSTRWCWLSVKNKTLSNSLSLDF